MFNLVIYSGNNEYAQWCAKEIRSSLPNDIKAKIRVIEAEGNFNTVLSLGSLSDESGNSLYVIVDSFDIEGIEDHTDDLAEKVEAGA